MPEGIFLFCFPIRQPEKFIRRQLRKITYMRKRHAMHKTHGYQFAIFDL